MSLAARLLKREHRRQRTGLSLRDFARNYAGLVDDYDPDSGALYRELSGLPEAATAWLRRKGLST